MRLLIAQLSQAFHFLPFRSKYFPQYPILQGIFKKQYQNLDLCIKYDLLYYVITTIQGGVFLHLKAGNQEGNSDCPCMNKKVKTTNIWYPSTLRSLINRLRETTLFRYMIQQVSQTTGRPDGPRGSG